MVRITTDPREALSSIAEKFIKQHVINKILNGTLLDHFCFSVIDKKNKTLRSLVDNASWAIHFWGQPSLTCTLAERLSAPPFSVWSEHYLPDCYSASLDNYTQKVDIRLAYKDKIYLISTGSTHSNVIEFVLANRKNLISACYKAINISNKFIEEQKAVIPALLLEDRQIVADVPDSDISLMNGNHIRACDHHVLKMLCAGTPRKQLEYVLCKNVDHIIARLKRALAATCIQSLVCIAKELQLDKL